MRRVMGGAISKWKWSGAVLRANGKGHGQRYKQMEGVWSGAVLQANEKGHGRCYKQMEGV